MFNLTDDELDILCKNSTDIQFQKGEKIIKQGSFTQNIVFVKEGIVKIHMSGSVKKDEIIKIQKGPAFVGVPDVFANKIHTYSVTALSDLRACFIEYSGYEYLVQNNGKFALAVIKDLSHATVNHYNFHIKKIHKQLTALFAEALLYFADNIFEKDSFMLPLTRSELGEYIGTTRETVTKIIHDFSVDKIIAVDGKSFTLINKEIIKKIAGI
jgi:CRP-like cAMP-binding protein